MSVPTKKTIKWVKAEKKVEKKIEEQASSSHDEVESPIRTERGFDSLAILKKIENKTLTAEEKKAIYQDLLEKKEDFAEIGRTTNDFIILAHRQHLRVLRAIYENQLERKEKEEKEKEKEKKKDA